MGEVKSLNVEKINNKIDNVSTSNKNESPIEQISPASEDNVFLDVVEIIDNTNEIDKAGAANLLNANGINYTEDDIKYIETRGVFGETTIITTNNGEEFAFENGSNGFVLKAIKLSDGTVIKCEFMDVIEEAIRRNGYLCDGIPIRGDATIEVNGKKTHVYWVGDDVDFETFKENLNNIKTGLSEYPDNVLDCIFSNTGFYGFYVGTFDSIPDYDSVDDAGTIAFAYGSDYIYINVDHPEALTTDTIVHEMAHILDWSLGEEDYLSEEDLKMLYYYQVYKQMIQQIELTGYPAEGFPDGVPSSTEFYAQAVAAYLEHPGELEALMPEVYYYIDDQFSNLKGGIFPW